MGFFKHKEISKNHPFQRETLKLLLKGWTDITRGMESIDQAVLRELTIARNNDIYGKKSKKKRK